MMFLSSNWNTHYLSNYKSSNKPKNTVFAVKFTPFSRNTNWRHLIIDLNEFKNKCNKKRILLTLKIKYISKVPPFTRNRTLLQLAIKLGLSYRIPSQSLRICWKLEDVLPNLYNISSWDISKDHLPFPRKQPIVNLLFEALPDRRLHRNAEPLNPEMPFRRNEELSSGDDSALFSWLKKHTMMMTKHFLLDGKPTDLELGFWFWVRILILS